MRLPPDYEEVFRPQEAPTGWPLKCAAIVAGLLALGCVGLLAGKARAQGVACAPWVQFIANLKAAHHEIPIGGGTINAGLIIKVLSSPDGKTFTIVTINANGWACAFISGTDWVPGSLPVKGVRL